MRYTVKLTEDDYKKYANLKSAFPEKKTDEIVDEFDRMYRYRYFNYDSVIVSNPPDLIPGDGLDQEPQQASLKPFRPTLNQLPFWVLTGMNNKS